MGRTNKQFRHVIGLGVEVAAPDDEEASRRVEDVRDALQARFAGSEIYPPRIAGSASRIQGSPKFSHFLLIGRPSEVDPFDSSVTMTETALQAIQANFESSPRNESRIEETATHLASLLRQNIAAGWIPSQGSISDAVEQLERALGGREEI